MEEYVWISKAINIDIFTTHAHQIMYRLGQEWHVEVTIAGPEDLQDEPFIQAIYDAIDRRAAGIMVHGWGVKEEIAAIDAAIESGIPVVTVDSDVPNSERLAHIGTDWFRMGSAMADQLVSLAGETGKILFMGNVYLINIQTGFRGFQYRMSTYPHIELFGPEDDSGIDDTVPITGHDKAEAVTMEWLERHPDISGIAGFDFNSGLGIASALEKMGLAGKVKVVCVDAETSHIEYIKKGIIQAAFSQRRKFFTYQAFQMLYAFNHGSASTGYQPGPINIAGNVDTGFIIVTKGNADSFEDEFNLDETLERQALTRRLALMSTVVESSGQMTLSTDIERHVTYANPASLRLTGMTEEQIIGTHIDQLFSFTEENRSLIAHCVSTETLVTFETTARREYGRIFPVQLTVSPMKTDMAERGLALIATDITDRKRAEAALQESETRWQFALEGAGDGVWDWNIQTNEVFFSLQWKAMLGFEEHEIDNTLDEWDKRVHPEDKEDTYAKINDHLTGKTPVYVSEHRMLCKDGDYKWILDRGKVVAWTGDGKPLRAIGTHADITERKQAEEALRLSNFALERTSDAVYWINLTTIVDVNEAACRMLGYSRDEFIGMPVTILDPVMTEADMIDAWESVRKEGSITFETWHKTKDGQSVPVELMANYIAFEGKEFNCCFVRDITERKQAEKALRQSEARYRALIESQIDLISRYRPDTTLTYVNDAYCQFYGKTREELIGQSYLLMVAPEFREVTRKEAEDLAKNPRMISGEYLNYGADGKARWIQWIVQCIVDESGQVTELQAVGRDITLLKETEAALQGSQEREREFQVKLKALHEVNLELVVAESIEEMCIRAIELGRSVLGYDRLGMGVFEDAEHSEISEYGIDAMGELQVHRGGHLSKDDVTVREVLTNPDLSFVSEDATLYDHAHIAVGHGWNIVTGLWDRNTSIGWLAADNLIEERPLIPYQVELLKLYGLTVGHLIARKRFEAAIQGSERVAREFLERLRALHEIGIELSAIQTLDSLYYQAVLAAKRLGIDRCGLFLFDDDQNLVGTYGTDESGNIRDERFLRIKLAEDSRELQLVKKAGGAHYWNDVELKGAEQVVGRGWSVMAILWNGPEPIGLIASDSYLTHEPPRPYTVELMGLYANLLGNQLAQKRAETQLRKLNEELEQRVIARTQELQEANEEIRQFAYIVSHDLRAPLVNLKGFASELRFSLNDVMDGYDALLPLITPTQKDKIQHALQEDIPEALRFIESSVSSMDAFTKAILKLSRLGRLTLELVAVDVKSLVEKTLQALAYQINQRAVTVVLGDLPVVVADLISMEQIIGNILTNAVTYLDPNRPGEIRISAEQKPNETVFRVRDNGRGIAEEDMDKVFAPFRRAGKQDMPGEGMGLAYVQTLVRRHGGRIWCESEAAAGTTFTFTIPRNLKIDILEL